VRCPDGHVTLAGIDEAVLDRMETRLKANPEILRQRREIVEHPFGSIKRMNQGAFLMHGLEKVTVIDSVWYYNSSCG
jgi:hypothetical protein